MSVVTAQAHGMGAPQRSCRSAPEYAATTPGCSSAPLTSTLVMRACAYGLRSTARWTAPGITRSLVNLASPVSSAGSSRRSIGVPMTRLACFSSTTVMSGSLRRREHRLHDVVVAGAAAEVALQADADVRLGGVRVLLEQADRGHHHPRRAVAALQPVVLLEGLLHRMQLAVRGQPLDGGERRAVGLRRQHRAALDRLAVDEDGAGPAARGVAADVRAGQPERVS